MLKKIFLLFILAYCASGKAQSYLPECSGIFYAITGNTPQVSNSGAPNTPSIAPFVFPAGANGLAVGPAFSFMAPDPTFWTFSNDTLCYSTGTAFVRSGHRVTNASALNIGGSAHFVYALNASTGQVYRYNGSGDAMLLTTVLSFSNGGLVEDIVGDELDNFYLLDLQTPQSLQVFNSSGAALCSYSLSGIPTSTAAAQSFAITGNTVNVQRGADYFIGIISGGGISFTQTAHTLNPPLDFASCPVSNSFTSVITSVTGPCLSSTLSLSATSSVGAVTYTWSGPGIAGAANSQAVLINQPGVYSCTLQSTGCLPQTSVCSYTVLQTPAVTATALTPTICSGSSATFSASGAATYTWSPGNYAGQSVIITTPPSLSHTVRATSAEGCTASAVAGFTVRATPVLTLTSSSYVLCPSTIYTLLAKGASNYTWSAFAATQPSVVNFSPANTTVLTPAMFTATGTTGPCSSTAALTITFAPAQGQVTIQAIPPVVCAGNSSTLIASGANSYTWGLFAYSNSIVATPLFFPVSNYTVLAENIYGCKKVASINVTISPIYGTIVPSPPGGEICSGAQAALKLNLTSLTNYTWNPSSATSSVILVSPTVTTVYTVSGTNSDGCPGSFTNTLTVVPTPTVTSNLTQTTVCQSGSVVLTVGGATGYTWEPGMHFGNTLPVFSPQASTVYTITGANGTCTAKSYINVMVNPNPALVIQNHQVTVCSGKSVTLSASGADTYTWGPSGSNSTAMMVTPVLPMEIYTVSGTFTNSGCSSVMFPVVYVSPTPTLTGSASPSIVCPGRSSTLSVSGAASYTWVQPAAYTSTCLVVPQVGGVYTVVGKSANCTSSLTVNLPVHPVPTLAVNGGHSVSVCPGNSIMLNATGAVTYTWNPGSHTGNTLMVTPSASSIYILSGTNAESCKSDMILDLYVLNKPVITAFSTRSLICEGEPVELQAIGAVSYTWSGNLRSGTVTVTPDVLPLTSYTVAGTGQNGCLSAAASVTVEVQECTGIEKHSSGRAGLLIYPNPGNGKFMLRLDQVSEDLSIEVYNSLGALLLVTQLTEETTRIMLQEYGNGIYLLLLKQKDRIIGHSKLIKE